MECAYHSFKSCNQNNDRRSRWQIYSRALTPEAKAMLKRNDWNIAEISYSLGFEDPAHFSDFFQKNAHFNLVEWRK